MKTTARREACYFLVSLFLLSLFIWWLWQWNHEEYGISDIGKSLSLEITGTRVTLETGLGSDGGYDFREFMKQLFPSVNEPPRLKKVNVCGFDSAESWSYIQSKKSCFGKKIIPQERVQACPWPNHQYKTSINVSGNENPQIRISPVPGDPSFKNYTKSEARALLKDKTIVFIGDSTMRRLFWSTCHFLNDEAAVFTADEHHNYRYADQICLFSSVTKYNLLLAFFGQLSSKELDNVFKVDILRAMRLRNILKHDATYLHSLVQNIGPKELEGASLLSDNDQNDHLHLFVQMQSWHVPVDCNVPSGVINIDTLFQAASIKNCGYSEYFTDSMKEDILLRSGYGQLDLTCMLVANFFERFRISKTQNDLRNIFLHGATNVPRGDLNSPKNYPKHNDWQNELLKSAFSLALGTDRCNIWERFVFNMSDVFEVINLFDQTGWMFAGKHWDASASQNYALYKSNYKNFPERHKCLIGTNHVENEQGQLMRVQQVLNGVSVLENRGSK